jgi:uncharacterized membrane protein YecN with MAPEG domain
MTFPALTAIYAALLALLFVALSIWVIAGRAKHRVHHGDGGNDDLNRRIRAHANFAEYVPLILLLVALLEAGGAGRGTVHALLLPLLAARLMHPVGMVAPVASVQQGVFRGIGASATMLILAAAAILLLIRVSEGQSS